MGLLYVTLALDAVALVVSVLLHRKHPDHGFQSIALITIVGMALAAIPVGVVFWIGFGVSAFVWALMLLKTHRPILRAVTGGRLGGLDKRRAALAALDNHARRYQVSIPERLRTFYADDFQRFDG